MTHRALIVVATVLLLAPAAQADTFVYVSVAAEKRLAAYRLDTDRGKLAHRGDCKTEDGESGRRPARWARCRGGC